MWQVEYTAEARAQRSTLPVDARRALDAAFGQIRRDPWRGRQYRGGYPPEYRMAAFGGWGLAVYLIRQQRGTLVVLEITWAGS